MRVYNMKLNPAKCAFGVNGSKFLGFMVTQRGMEVNLNQIRAVMETFAPNNKNELQHLTGRLATLRRFIAWFTYKLRFFFLILNGANVIGWMDDCELAFEWIKHYYTQPPILSSPEPDKQLHMYLAVSDYAVSVVLSRHLKDKEHRLTSYESKTMVNVETQYSKME